MNKSNKTDLNCERNFCNYQAPVKDGLIETRHRD